MNIFSKRTYLIERMEICFPEFEQTSQWSLLTWNLAYKEQLNRLLSEAYFFVHGTATVGEHQLLTSENLDMRCVDFTTGTLSRLCTRSHGSGSKVTCPVFVCLFMFLNRVNLNVPFVGLVRSGNTDFQSETSASAPCQQPKPIWPIPVLGC